MLSLFQTKPHGCLKLHVNEDPSPDRSSHWRCCIKEGVPKNFTGKHVYQSLFFNNLQSISGRLLLTCFFYTIFSNILIQYSKLFFAVWIRKTVHGSRYLTWKEFTLIFFSKLSCHIYFDHLVLHQKETERKCTCLISMHLHGIFIALKTISSWQLQYK